MQYSANNEPNNYMDPFLMH